MIVVRKINAGIARCFNVRTKKQEAALMSLLTTAIASSNYILKCFIASSLFRFGPARTVLADKGMVPSM